MSGVAGIVVAAERRDVQVKRRDFITLFGGAFACWPVAANAQRPDRMRRIVALMGWSESNPQFRALQDVLIGELARLGWREGHNVQIDVRWTGGDPGRTETFAKELVALQPDLIFATTTPPTAAMQRQTRVIPIVFAIVADPVGVGFVAGLPQPGGNITGFTNAVTALGGKWLELLKTIAPNLKRVAMMFNPDTAPSRGTNFLSSFEAAAQSLGIEPISTPVHSDADIEATIVSLGREQAGLVLMADGFLAARQGMVISLAARNNVPVEGADFPTYARDGGLLSYGANFPDVVRRAGEYVDRILRGEKPAVLPVQQPNKFDLVVNLKTARALGLTVPASLLVSASEVIE
jgi:putative ABC transport system substrate-binding protein